MTLRAMTLRAMMLTRLMPVVLACAALGTPVPAQETTKVKLCNETSFFLNVAMALRLGAASKSQGWLQVMPGKCETGLLASAGTDEAFVYAQSDVIYSGPVQRFEGNEQFCISFDGDFDIDGRRDCRERGFVAVDFALIDNNTDTPEVTFTDPLDFSRRQAKTAAAQRLLSALDYDIGRIDGLSGRRTLSSLHAFQKTAGHPKSNKVTNDLLTDLYEKAALKAESRGLLLCNKTNDLIWAAIGRVKGDGFKTEGWLSIDSQKCRKAINEELTARYYFVYAEAVDTSGNPVIRAGRRQVWNGSFELCTKPTRFAIETRNDCAGQGLDKTGFMKIDTGAETNWVLNFE
ncbi:MAG: DUF1036 domain-containing protein [Parvibaculales bacterium]